MSESDKKENVKESQEKKVKKKASKVAEEQAKESVKESTEEKGEEKSDAKTNDKEHLRDDVPTESPLMFEAISLTKPIKTRQEVEKSDLIKLSELKEAFQLFDFNRDGVVDLEDLKFTFMSMGRSDVPEEQLQQMLSEMPDPVDFDAFVALFGRKVTEMEPEEVFTAALSTWDTRDIGMIPEERIRDDLQRFGDRFTSKDVDRALEEAPVYLQDGDSMIDYIKFSNNICGFRNLSKARQYQKNLENA